MEMRPIHQSATTTLDRSAFSASHSAGPFPSSRSARLHGVNGEMPPAAGGIGVGAGAGGVSGGGVPRTAISSLAKWKEHLAERSQRQARLLRSEVATLHRGELHVERRPCMWCARPTCKLDMVEFLCHPERRPQTAAFDPRAAPPPHAFCIACVTHLIKEQQRYYKREYKAQRAAGEDTRGLEWLLDNPIKLLPCPICKSPNVLTLRTCFRECLSRDQVDATGATPQYIVHFAATRTLCDNYSVEEVFQNERRPLFGSFSVSNMLTLDWRGPVSNGGGSALEHTINEKPNRAWVWLETHAPDVTLPCSGIGGWQYAGFSWPQDPSDYDREVSLFHFVRRRRLLHTRVRLSEDVLQQLLMVGQEMERTGHGIAKPMTPFTQQQQQHQHKQQQQQQHYHLKVGGGGGGGSTIGGLHLGVGPVPIIAVTSGGR